MYNRCMVEFRCDHALNDEPVPLKLVLDANTVTDETTAKHVQAAVMVMFKWPARIQVRKLALVRKLDTTKGPMYVRHSPNPDPPTSHHYYDDGESKR